MAQSLGTAPRRAAAGVWVTHTGRELNAAGGRYWENLYRAGRTDGKGHMVQPSVVMKQPAQARPSTPSPKEQKVLRQAHDPVFSKPKQPSFFAPRAPSATAIGRQGVNYHPGRADLTQAFQQRYPQLERLFEKSAKAAPTVNPVVGRILESFNPVPHITDALANGNPSAAGIAADIGMMAIPGPLRLVSGGAKAIRALRAGETAVDAIKAGRVAYKESRPIVAAGTAVGRAAKKYVPRTIQHNDLVQQLPKARSRITQVGEKVADKASVALQKSERATKTPVVRLATAGDRVAKAAGRAQRVELPRRAAAVHGHLDAIKQLKEGSPEDQANFWYAQIPASHHNAEGLRLVRGKQAEELAHLVSGQALQDLTRQEHAINAALRTATPEERYPLLGQLQDVKVRKTDIPHRIRDVAASIHTLDRLIEKPPAPNAKAIAAARHLGEDTGRIYMEAGRLVPERAAARRQLVPHWLGLEPTGHEAYVGHRLPSPTRKLGMFKVSGGTGRVKSPPGVGSENRLILAKTGRLRQSLHVAAEDWHHAQTFEMANKARTDLGKMGTPFPGHVPEGHVLVNPNGRTIPAHWRRDELTQFKGDYSDSKVLHERAKEIVNGFIADNPQAHADMLKQAAHEGVNWNELKVVPQRHVDRYYSQFKRMNPRGTAGKAYDAAVDAVATSIVFARVGYIPKNMVQNIVMAVPHQGAHLPQNAVKAAQAMADPQLRAFIRAEIHGTGATGAVAREAGFRAGLGKIAGVMSTAADDPIRATAYMHELQAAKVISRAHPMMTAADKQRLLDFFRNPAHTALKNDVRSRTVEAMADFSRMTPDQARLARRFMIVPGWLMAGSRYPFHFAATHPVRSALLAYIAMGEPGAPKELRFNKPLDQYFAHGMPNYLEGIPLPNGKYLRTGSLNPVTTPYDLAQSVVGSVKGKKNPFSHPDTIFDNASPFAAAAIRAAQGEGLSKSLQPLAPSARFIQGMISPKASATYPEDASRIGRLKREIGILPIKVDTALVQARQAGLHSSSLIADKRALQAAFKKAGYQWPAKLEQAYGYRAQRAAALDKISSKGDQYQHDAFNADLKVLVAAKLMTPGEAKNAAAWGATAAPAKLTGARRYLGEHYFGVGLIAESKRYVNKHAKPLAVAKH